MLAGSPLGEGRRFPVRFFVADGESVEKKVLTAPGRIVIDLPAVAAGSRRLFVLWADRVWTPDTADQRRLGVKLSLVGEDTAGV